MALQEGNKENSSWGYFNHIFWAISFVAKMHQRATQALKISLILELTQRI